MTLSWGTADMAVEMAIPSGAREAAVIGAGGVGLATARLLQRRGFQVTVFAKSLPPDTTSNKSGAQWWPVSVFDRDRLTPKFRELFLRAARLSYQHYQNVVGDEYGIRWVRNYLLSEEAPVDPESRKTADTERTRSAARAWPLASGERVLHQASIIDDGEHRSESVDVDERVVADDDQIGLEASPH